MRFDLLTVLKLFALCEGRLYRKQAGGTLKPVTHVEQGRLLVRHAGIRYYGPDIAWALLHGATPLFPVFQLNDDPFDLTPANLACARIKRLRCRITSVPGGFKHPLMPGVFATEIHARRDWLSRARQYYDLDLPYVFELQNREKAARGPIVVPEDKRRVKAPKSVVPKAPRAAKPEDVPGRTWRWFKGQWVSIPKAVHQSDDWMVRAAAVLKDASAMFVYDELAERTVLVQA